MIGVPSAVAPPGTSSARPDSKFTIVQYPEKERFQRLYPSNWPGHGFCVMSVSGLDVDNQNQNHNHSSNNNNFT